MSYLQGLQLVRHNSSPSDTILSNISLNGNISSRTTSKAAGSHLDCRHRPRDGEEENRVNSRVRGFDCWKSRSAICCRSLAREGRNLRPAQVTRSHAYCQQHRRRQRAAWPGPEHSNILRLRTRTSFWKV